MTKQELLKEIESLPDNSEFFFHDMLNNRFFDSDFVIIEDTKKSKTDNWSKTIFISGSEIKATIVKE